MKNEFLLKMKKMKVGRLLFSMLLSVLLLGALQSFSQITVGPTFTTTASSTGGGADWNNLGNITGPGTFYVNSDAIADGNSSENLNATNYGFSIPLGATIQGITVNIRRYSTETTADIEVNDADVQLLKGGVPVGTDLSTGSTYPVGLANVATATYGGSSNLWGTTWTAAEINAAGFGVTHQVNVPSVPGGNSGTAYVDWITVSVTYICIPTITGMPTNIGVDNSLNNCFNVVTWPSPVATADCGTVTLTVSNAPGSVFPVGLTTVLYTATSASGGVSTASFTVNVNDVQAPAIATPANILAGTNSNTDCTATQASVGLVTPTTSDNCSVLSVTNNAPALFPFGPTTVTWVVTDIHGNVNTATNIVTVYDANAPILSTVANVTADTDDDGLGNCDVSLTILDVDVTNNCGSYTLTYTSTGATTLASPLTGINQVGTQVFNKGVTTVTYVAVDAAGLSGTTSFTVTVTDNEVPIIGTVTNVTSVTSAGGTGDCAGTAAVPSVVFTDNCPGVTLTYAMSGATTVTTTAGQAPANGTYNKGVTTITYVATDAVGLTATKTLTVTITDDENPILGAVGDVVTTTSSDGTGNCPTSVVIPSVSVTENCSTYTLTWAATGATTLSSPATGMNQLGTQIFNKGTTTVTYTVTDGAGLTATKSFTVTITDDELPTLSVPNSSLTFNTTLTQCSRMMTPIANVTYADNCPGAQLSFSATGSTTISTTNGQVGNFRTFNKGVTTIIYKVTDAAGNVTTSSMTITVVDNQAPIMMGEINTNISVNNDQNVCTAMVSWDQFPTFMDNCGASNVTLTSNWNPGDNFPVGTTTVTYTATDEDGNATSESFFITVSDVQKPVIATPANIIAGTNSATSCTATLASVGLVNPTNSDNCGVASVTNDAPALFPFGPTVVTWTVTDVNGLTATSVQTVTVYDAMAPVFTAAVSGVLGGVTTGTSTDGMGNCSTAIAMLATPAVTDACSSFTVVAKVGGATITPTTYVFPKGGTTISWVATDVAGNVSTATQVITVQDNEAPVITPAANVVVYTYSEEDYNCSNSVEIAPLVYSDNCDATASLTITWSMAGATNSGVTTSQVGTQIFNVGVTTVTYTVRDLASNMSSNQFTVTVIDNSAPIVTAIQGNVVTTTSADGGYNCNTAVAISPIVYSDNCTTTPTLTYAMSGANSVNTTIGQVPSPYTFNKGVTYITYVIKDDAVVGNTTTRVVTVTVNDNEFPVISNMPSSVTKDAALGLCNAVHTWTMPSSADNCGVVSFTSNFQSGYAFPVGVTVVVYTAVDAANNATTASFTVTVKDTQLPAIVKTYANVTVNNTPGKCAGIATWPALTLTDATDNCGVATVTSSHVSGSEFPVGTTVVTVTAKDINGNSAAKTFTVTVKDNEKPVIVNLPANVVLDNEGANCYGVGLWTAPTATDNCGIASLTGSSMSGLHMAIGTTTVTYTATDVNGNVTTASFTVTVKDTGKPVFAGVPANISVNNVAGKCEGVATWVAPTVTDACGTIATVTSNYASGATFAAGVTTVIYTATDNAGNVSTASFTVTVTDNEKPVIAGVPANISLTNAAGKCGAPATWTAPTATDNCGVKTIVSVPASGTEFAVGTTTVTVTATDNSGNVSTAAFTVTVTDTEKPVIACPATLTVKLGWRLDYAVVTEGGLGTPTTSDNCGVKTVTNNFASLYPTGQLKLGTYTVTWTVTDVNGNSSSCTQTIVVNAIPTGTNELSLESALKAWPNPFTDRANIEFSNVNDSHARLEIFSITGAKLKTLFEGNIKGGQSYKAEYTPNGISSQIVIYRLTMGDDVRTGKLIYQGLK